MPDRPGRRFYQFRKLIISRSGNLSEVEQIESYVPCWLSVCYLPLRIAHAA
jgi:hypothetical protein